MISRFSVVLLVIFLICRSVPASGQRFSSEVWHSGKLVLLEGETLEGRIKYDMENKSVLYTSDGNRVQAYSPKKILSFELYDEVLQAYRIFYILPYRDRSGYEAPYIFELSYEGPYMSLLRIEEIELVVRSMPYMYSTWTDEEVVYTYFFLDRRGLLEFNGKKSDIPRVFRDRPAEMKRFIKDERLKLDRLDHLIRICSHYNSLLSQ